MNNNFPLLPDQASTFAKQVDDIALVITLLTVFFTVAVMGMLVFLAIRYRRGSNVNRESSGSHNIYLEIGWTLPPLVLGLGMFAWSVKPYAEVFNPPPDAEEIFVIGKRWMWHMQHTVNGIRENNELHIPMGRPFKLTLISQDVIHGFYVPDFRMKRDAMPGQFNTVWFEATKPGKHHLFCTEYCGTDHSQMGGWVYVLSPQDYNLWVKSNGTSTQPVESPVQAGFDLYTQLACANCHKEQDSLRAPTLYNLPGRYRNLQNGTTVIADDNYIRKAIRVPDENVLQGYSPTMPSYKDNLDEQQIHDLIMYIKSLGNGSPPPVKAKVGSIGGAGGTLRQPGNAAKLDTVLGSASSSANTPAPNSPTPTSGSPAPTGSLPAESPSGVRTPAGGSSKQ
jgi:cytochrome c oxidase subunit 2